MDLELALEEEIGNPNLFVGRQKEIDFFLAWLAKVKNKFGHSTAVLARRRKGKTALLQRFFNIVYTRNDPMLIPFYFRIPEKESTLLNYSDHFYRSLLSAYYGFKTRNPEFINMPLEMHQLEELAADDRVILNDIRSMKLHHSDGNQEMCWELAHNAGHRISTLKDERIVQILDEFQYLDNFVFFDKDARKPMTLTGSYQHTGSSQLVWVRRILLYECNGELEPIFYSPHPIGEINARFLPSLRLKGMGWMYRQVQAWYKTYSL